MSELLNCPFCGSRCVTLLNGGPGNHYVRCDDCLASSNDVGRDRAVELWNRRTLAPAQGAVMRSEIDDVLKHLERACAYQFPDRPPHPAFDRAKELIERLASQHSSTERGGA